MIKAALRSLSPVLTTGWVAGAAFLFSAASAADVAPCKGFAPAAGESYSAYSERADRRDCVKPWTILVYMAADNDLAPYALWDLYEMEAGYRSGARAAGSTARSDLIVHAILPGQADARRLHIFQQTEPYDDRITVDGFKKRGVADVRSPVASLAPRRTASGAVVAADDDLAEFLRWGMSEYPAEHYMVIVWGHGQGWAPGPRELAGRGFGGLAFSDTGNTFLDIPSLHGVLKGAAGLLGRPIDVYASDACLMQMLEVAYEVSDSTRFLVGSSQVENYLGLPYRRLMYELNTNRFLNERKARGVAGSALERDEPYLLARILPKLFKSSLQKHGLHARAVPKAIETVTMSSISNSELRTELMPSLKRLSQALQAYLAEDEVRAIDLSAAMRETPSFMGGSQEAGGFFTTLRKMVRDEESDPAEWTRGARAVDQAAAEAARALDRTMVAYALGTHYTGEERELYLMGFRAAALWLPSSERDYLGRIQDFSSSLFYRETRWDTWLKTTFVAPTE